MTTTFRIEGMTCGGCVASVTKALERAGMKAEVSLKDNTATITGTGTGTVDEAKVKAAIEAAGFQFGGRAG